MKIGFRISRTRAVAIAVSLLIGVSTALYLQFGRRDAIGSFLEDRYGKPDSHGTYLPEGTDSVYAYSVCARKAEKVRGEDHVLLAVCGGDSTDSGAAQPGVIDFYVLRGNASKATLVVELTDQKSGFMGHPGKVEIARLGTDFFGFVRTSDYALQGFSIKTATIFVPTREGIREATTFTTEFSNVGNMSDEQNIHEVNRSWKIDRAVSRTVFPIRVKEVVSSGTRKRNADYELIFDPSKHTYVASKGFVPTIDY